MRIAFKNQKRCSPRSGDPRPVVAGVASPLSPLSQGGVDVEVPFQESARIRY